MTSPTVIVLAASFFLAAADDKPDYSQLSRLIHQAVVEKVPKVYEDRADWGRTVPIPGPIMRFDRLRTRVQVGDRLEFPDGVWQRSKLWLDDPAKNIQIQVRDLRLVDGKTRLSVETTIALHGERERRRWRNGIQLFGITVQADALVAVTLDFDLKITLKTDKFPPEVEVEPKVVQSRLELKTFDLVRVGNVLLDGELARDVGNELKGLLQELLRQREPDVTEYANQAILRGLSDGKGTISMATLLKAGVPVKAKE